MGCGCRSSFGKEAGGIVNNIKDYKNDNIDIRAASSVIYDEMIKNLKDF